MTSCCWLVVMGSERFASPIMGIFCGGLNAYCMRIWPLFLRTSGSSGVLKALLLERNRQLSCNQKKKKKKKKHGILTPGASVYRPRLLPLPGSDQTSAQVLQELESRWTASLQASPSGRDRLSSDLPDSQPAWMAPSRGHRQHWSERQQQQRAQQQQPAQQPQQLPSDRDANNDTPGVPSSCHSCQLALPPLASHDWPHA